MDDFDNFSVEIDTDCLHQDFDDYDLFGEIMETNDNNIGEDICYE